jgi:7-carboxy-7-deazaguanine synthase (Cx14CxxC type)
VSYAVKEIYYTLQGEGAQAGRPAVFLRFTGCNLWTGLEKDRAKGPGGCSLWCDTNFVGTDGPNGGKFQTADALAQRVYEQWPQSGASAHPLVVCTGGEPLLQLDDALLAALRQRGFSVAVETNGTVLPPAGPLWLTVSPKANAPLKLTRGHELKLVYPQIGAEPERFAHLDFRHFYLQPLDGPSRAENTERALDYCLQNPQWRLSVQMHKVIGIP